MQELKNEGTWVLMCPTSKGDAFAVLPKSRKKQANDVANFMRMQVGDKPLFPRWVHEEVEYDMPTGPNGT